MTLKPIALDELGRQRGGLRLGDRRVSFGIHSVGRGNGGLIATYRYRMAQAAPAPAAASPAPPRAPAPVPGPAAANPRPMSTSAAGKASVRMQNVEPVTGNLLTGRFDVRGPKVVVRTALPRPSEPAVNYLTTGQGGLKRPVRPQQVGRFRVITSDDPR